MGVVVRDGAALGAVRRRGRSRRSRKITVQEGTCNETSSSPEAVGFIATGHLRILLAKTKVFGVKFGTKGTLPILLWVLEKLS